MDTVTLDNSGFNKLALCLMLAYDTPVGDRAWQTKTACESPQGLDEAFLAGFYGGMLPKQASDNETYILGSELGKELGINILYNMKESLRDLTQAI
jgi:hypothetical protein